MAIRTTTLGGTDFTDGEVIEPADHNDTFNAANYLNSFPDMAQLIFNAGRIGFNTNLDMHTGWANNTIKNKILYNVFSSDNMSTHTGLTWDDTYDYYHITGTPSALELISITSNEPDSETITNAMLVLNYNLPLAVTEDNKITNGGFEDEIGTEWVYSETATNWTNDGRSSVGPYAGTYLYKLSHVNDVSSGYCQIAQPNVNLTGVTHIGLYIKDSSTNIQLEVLVDGVSCGTTGINSGTYSLKIFEIPLAKRTTGMTVALRFTDSVYGTGYAVYIDNVSTYVEETITNTFYLSADNGTHYEEVTPNVMHKFTNTGTQLKFKMTSTSDGVYVIPAGESTPGVSEYGIKYISS